MRKSALVIVGAALVLGPAPSRNVELTRWEQQANNITIVRDDWGIAHVTGKTDADAVFGMVYAQAEDDFNRVETNFIDSQGRLAEAEGESAIWRDLRMKLFIDPDSMKMLYSKSPEWMKTLMVAWADGLNFYLAKHPDVKPRVITKFEPWMALTFSEGSIGGDISAVNLGGIQAFYSGSGLRAGAEPANGAAEHADYAETAFDENGNYNDYEPRGSNGIAVAPKNTKNGRALLLINPHTSHYFRAELQMTSEEGLNAYGASTWGQFFIYQGFNEKAGWMHTTSAVDATDEFLETVTEKSGKYFYKFGNEERSFIAKKITIPYKTASGMATRDFEVYYTHFGPVIRAQGGKWVAYRLMQDPINALSQSWSRTKARNIDEYKKSMALHGNTSNATLYADADGNIAYFHPNFIPRRDTKFNWRQPVDGSDPASEWKDLLSFEESPNSVNPASGWAYNANDWPWAASGPSSPKQADFPAYVDNGNESHRGRHAVIVLENKKDFDIEGLRAAAYDTYLPGFDKSIPALIRAYDATPASDPVRQKVADQIEQLRKWDLRWSVSSVPTTLAIYYTQTLQQAGRGGRGGRGGGRGAAAEPSAAQQLTALAAACERLTADFGKCNTPWGDINRFQRLANQIVPSFDDSKPSIPVGFPSATYGSLASYGARAYPNTKKWYGTSGNSFVAVVEFGKDSVRAVAITAGGESGDVNSKHFNDQAQRFVTGQLRPVYFYPNQLKGHTARTYKPGN
ncbi:MAG: penicillin acylase family protein [Gemmatimonadetes bacterium]|nr:penicillin acylase family protein [Gemmatimonadota bacterium]